MPQFLARLIAHARTNKPGQAMVEYALILALVSVVAILMLAAIGDEVNVVFNNVVQHLTAAT